MIRERHHEYWVRMKGGWMSRNDDWMITKDDLLQKAGMLGRTNSLRGV
jgi:hypothetical protein